METAQLIILIISSIIAALLAVYFGVGLFVAFILTRIHDENKRLFGKYKYINKIEKTDINAEEIIVLGYNSEIFRSKLFRVANSHKYVIMAPSYFGSSDSLNYAVNIFNSAGISCVVAQMRGSSKNTGKFVSFGFYENYDLQSHYDYIKSKDENAVINFYGEGTGASAVIMAAGDKAINEFVIAYNPYFSMEKLIESNTKNIKVFREIIKWFMRHFCKVYIEQLNPDMWLQNSNANIYIINDDSDIINASVQNEFIKDIKYNQIKLSGKHLLALRNDTRQLEEIIKNL